MNPGLAADAVVVAHFAFVAFVMLGGFLAWWRRWVAVLHIPAALWGAYAELTGTLCPLTPIENALRAKAGETGYEGGFVDHYLMPLLYPAGLTPTHQLAIGVLVVVINVAVYAEALRRTHRRDDAASRDGTA